MIQKLEDVIGEIIDQGTPAGTLLRQVDNLKACEKVLKSIFPMALQALRIDKGILTVLVDNSMIAQEISFRRGELIKALNEHHVDNPIKDIKLKISGDAT